METISRQPYKSVEILFHPAQSQKSSCTRSYCIYIYSICNCQLCGTPAFYTRLCHPERYIPAYDYLRSGHLHLFIRIDSGIQAAERELYGEFCDLFSVDSCHTIIFFYTTCQSTASFSIHSKYLLALILIFL